MKNLEELLDDEDFQERLLSPINKELRGLSYWLRLSAGMLLCIAVLGLLLLLNIFSTTYYYPSVALVVVSGMLVSCIALFFLVYTHFHYAESVRNFMIGETDDELEELAKAGRSDWRTFFIILFFVTVSIGYAVGNMFYSIYYWDYYVEPPVMPERLSIPDEEFPIAPIEEEALEELEELEEDPAPPSD